MERVPLNIWLLFYCSDKTDLFSTNHIKYYFLSVWSTVPLKVKKLNKEINRVTCFCFTSDENLFPKTTPGLILKLGRKKVWTATFIISMFLDANQWYKLRSEMNYKSNQSMFVRSRSDSNMYLTLVLNLYASSCNYHWKRTRCFD